MKIARPTDWESRLSAYLSAAESRPFTWGYHDCVHFAAGWMRTLGYPDPLAVFGEWRSPLSAARVIRNAGGFDAAVAERMNRLGCPPIPPLTARRGAVALLRIDERRLALGIVTGTHAAAPGIYSLQSLPVLTRAVRAWRI